ncbi:MAG TPA: hypothetical protein VIZ30_09975 [Pseudomonadales bacterium]
MKALQATLLCAGAIHAASALAWELDARAKLFGNAQLLPEDDLQRVLDETPAYEGSADLRLMFREAVGGWHLLADLTTLNEAGDQFAFVTLPQETLDQTPRDDRLRFMNLTWTLQEGARHELIQRFDRLALEYRAERWGVTVGRQAISWGGGIVFQPLDLFAPFAPTTVDRDYKPGEDLVKIDGVTEDGSDWQAIGVFRRNVVGERETSVDSFGAKWRGAVGATEFEVLGGRHYRDNVFGMSLKRAVGGALVRTDWLLTDLDEGGVKVSGIVNVDYSFMWLAHNWYAFGEYFHSGFGTNRHPVALNGLPVALRDRLLRGELFTLMQDYTALGARLEWHPLVSQSVTLLTNLHDGSSLVQTQLSFEPSDAQHLDFGYVRNFGDDGDEYGEIPLPPPAAPLTTGGGAQWYLRWAYFW